MMFVDMPQHKQAAVAAAFNIMMLADGQIMMTQQTADHANACCKAMCRSMQNHVISPSAILLHVSQVISPR